jgi:hypothetical protein
MTPLPPLARRGLPLVLALALLGCMLLGLAARPAEALGPREAAFARWRATGPARYEVAVEATALGRTCYQQVEVAYGRVQPDALDTCASPWLQDLTIPQIFALIDEVNDIPASRCSPGGNCACHRIFITRRTVYNDALGYPELLYSRSEVVPNWRHIDFWNYLLEHGALPTCAPAPRILQIRVLWLAPRS